MRGAERPARTTYDIPGVGRLPRVSTILATIANPGIVAWKLKVGSDEAGRISKAATDHGTRTHRSLELVSLEFSRAGIYVTPGEDADLHQSIRAYQEWLDAHVERVVATERLCVSRQHLYAGTCDAVLELRDGSLAVVDYKTSKVGPWGMDPAFRCQLAAYRLALAEDGLICQRRIVLQLPSNEPGRLIVHELTEHRKDTEAFLNLLALYRWLEAHR